MAVQLAPLQLEGYYIQELSFKIRPGLEDQLNGQMQIGIDLQHETLFNPDPLTVNVQAGAGYLLEDPFRWKCLVNIESNLPPERRFPYDFRAVLVGYFKVHPQVPRESVENLVKVNAPSLLYSAARELLASVTGRGPLPAVLLPTVVFTPDAEPKQLQPTTPESDTLKGSKKAAKQRPKKRAAKKAGSKKQQR